MTFRTNLNPTSDHRFSSEHCVGWRKTYENNIPNKVPKTGVFKERKFRNSLGLIQKRSVM